MSVFEQLWAVDVHHTHLFTFESYFLDAEECSKRKRKTEIQGWSRHDKNQQLSQHRVLHQYDGHVLARFLFSYLPAVG